MLVAYTTRKSGVVAKIESKFGFHFGSLILF